MLALSDSFRFNLSSIMKAAWSAFRDYHRFSGIKAGSPEGRRSFGQFLTIEWRNARRAAKVAAGTVADLAERLGFAERRVALAMHQDAFRRHDAEEASARLELAQLRDHARRAGLRLAA
jgi:sulfur carrier protein ThiS